MPSLKPPLVKISDITQEFFAITLSVYDRFKRIRKFNAIVFRNAAVAFPNHRLLWLR